MRRLVDLLPGMGLFYERRYKRTLAAAQLFCQLLGDAERLLDREVTLWEQGDKDRVHALWESLPSHFRAAVKDNPTREVGKIREWKTKMAGIVREYSIDIGQPGKGPGRK